MADKPKLNTEGQKELEKVELHFQKLDAEMRNLSAGSVEDTEPQTKLSTREVAKLDAPYLKPHRTINSKEQFNEKYRNEFNFDKEYVKVIAEHNELIGDTIEVWTKPYAGMSAEFWRVPTNQPVWMPRYLAKQLSTRTYIRYSMQEPRMTGTEGGHQFYTGMIGKDIRKRLDCREAGNQTFSMFAGK